MSLFVTTDTIFENSWNYIPHDNTVSLPPQESWNENTDIKLDDIKIWEQIYFEPGNVGVYAAWNPYVEFYMITFNCFLKDKKYIEIYQGSNSANEVLGRLKDFGINLDYQEIWID